MTPPPPAVYRAWLADRFATDEEIARAPLTDLYLACVCASGDAKALALFETNFLGEVGVAAAKLRAAVGVADEARQVVRNILFVGNGAIASYAGRGDLRGWVRVIAMREVLRLCKTNRHEVATDDEELLAALSPATDPELEQLKERYRHEFNTAFADAVRGLEGRERELLRMSVVDGLGVEQIGKKLGVHHATAARWLIKAREALLDGTRDQLAKRLSLPQADVDSVIRLVRSRIEVSIERLLKP